MGGDILINYEGLQIDAEYFVLSRTGSDFIDFEGNQWHVRLGYSIILFNRYFELARTYDNYTGRGTKILYKFIGIDNTLDFGINWYLNKDKLKLALHYVMQDGTISNTGDYAGLALQFRL